MRNWKSSALAVVALALNLVVADAASAQDFGYDTGGLNTYSIAPVVPRTDPGGLNAYSIVPEVSRTVPVTQNTEPNANVVMWDVDVVTWDSLFSAGYRLYSDSGSKDSRFREVVYVEEHYEAETSWDICYHTVVYDMLTGIESWHTHCESTATGTAHDPIASESVPDTGLIRALRIPPLSSRSDPLNEIPNVATNIDDWPLPNGPANASSIDNLSDDEDNASVPEPSLIIGTMLALAAGIKVLKRGHEQ